MTVRFDESWNKTHSSELWTVRAAGFGTAGFTEHPWSWWKHLSFLWGGNAILECFYPGSGYCMEGEAGMAGGQSSSATAGCAVGEMWVSFLTHKLHAEFNSTGVHLPGAVLVPPWGLVPKKLCPKSHFVHREWRNEGRSCGSPAVCGGLCWDLQILWFLRFWCMQPQKATERLTLWGCHPKECVPGN